MLLVLLPFDDSSQALRAQNDISELLDNEDDV
jgi:hypothetical protein